MFNCDQCRAVVGPKVSPVMVTSVTRIKEYAKIDQETGMIVSAGLGTETEVELALCPSCAGVKPRSAETPNLAALALGRAMQAHASGCSGKKKSTKLVDGVKVKVEETCPVCAKNIKDFLTIPDNIMNILLTEPPAHIRPPSLVSRAVDRMIDRTTHGSKRGKADVLAGMALFQAYEQAGGGL